MSRDTRELLGDRGSTFIGLSIDTIGLALRLFVAEKSSFEGKKSSKTALPAKF